MIILLRNWPPRRAIVALAQPPHSRYGIHGVPDTDAAKFSAAVSLTLYMMFVTKFLFAVYIGIALNWPGDQFAVPLIAECYMASYMFYFSLYVLTRVLRLPGRINAVVGEHQS